MTAIPITIIIIIWGLRHFQHCSGHITMGSWKDRGNQYIQFVRDLYCKLPTNGKQLPAFPLEAMPGAEPWPQRWEARVLPLCHRKLVFKYNCVKVFALNTEEKRHQHYFQNLCSASIKTSSLNTCKTNSQSQINVRVLSIP